MHGTMVVGTSECATCVPCACRQAAGAAHAGLNGISHPRWRLANLGRSWTWVLRRASAAGIDTAARRQGSTRRHGHGAAECGPRRLVPDSYRWVRPQAMPAVKRARCAKGVEGMRAGAVAHAASRRQWSSTHAARGPNSTGQPNGTACSRMDFPY